MTALGDDATVPKILLLSDNKWVGKGLNRKEQLTSPRPAPLGRLCISRL